MSSPAKRLLAYSFFVFVINAYICHELFIRSYIPAMGSVEGSFISISRYAMENSGDLGWCPLWFNGMPWHNIYQPGLHVSVAAIAKAFQLEPALVYHCLTALFYCLGPVTLFWAAYVLSAEMEASLVVGVLYSLFSP